jgi:hypothetical protein
MKTGSKLAIAVFSIVAVAHLLRLVYAVDLSIGSWNAPMWVSVLGVIGPGVIAILLWRESK